MDKDAYIKQLEAENAALKHRIQILEKRIEELERRVGMNSQNSSKPPSSDPPGARISAPTRRRKKRGAKPGHPPHLRTPLPPQWLKERIVLKPAVCSCSSAHLRQTDWEPLRHQIVDIPPIVPEVVEYVQPLFECADCGAVVYHPLPETIKRRCFGPGVLSLVGILTGYINTSKRKALALINEVFSIPMSLGGLSQCEAQLAGILEQPYHEATEHVHRQQTAYADETGWPRGHRLKGWLWTLCCATAAVFVVQAGRGQAAAQKLLGCFAQALHCDRRSGYNGFPGRRFAERTEKAATAG